MQIHLNSSASADPAHRPSARAPGDQLSFHIRRRGETVVLGVRGEADAFTLALWRQRVREAADMAADAGGALIVDAGRLGFLSLRTLAALAADSAGYLRDGVRTCLVIDAPRIARLAGADPRTAALPIRSTVVGALTALNLPRRTTGAPMVTGQYRTSWIAPDVPATGHTGPTPHLVAEPAPESAACPPRTGAGTGVPHHR